MLSHFGIALGLALMLTQSMTASTPSITVTISGSSERPSIKLSALEEMRRSSGAIMVVSRAFLLRTP